MKKLKVGKILTTHGLKGELKIKSSSDYAPERFKKGAKLFLTFDKRDMELEIATSRVHKGNYLVSFVGYQDINLVEQFKGIDVYGIKDETLLDEDEIYYDDLIGCKVEDQDGNLLGEVTDMMETAAHDILIMKSPKNKKVMIPYVDAFIKEIDLDEDLIIIENMAGLIDED